MGNVLLAGSARIWTIKFRAGPDHEPFYHPSAMLTAPDWPQGDVTKIEQPSDLAYNQWEEIQSFQNSADRATGTITVYEYIDRSEIMELVRLRCAFDVQVHSGTCEDPRDFNYGWDKITVFPDDRATGYSNTDLGAMKGENQADRQEEMPFSGRSIYHILRMSYREVAANEVGEEVMAVDVCDLITCGDCEGTGSDGCQKVFAITNPGAGSPGVLPQVIVTTDQFGTNAIIERWITTMALTDTAVDAACVGSYFVVLSYDGEEIHFAPTADIVDSAETWTAVATGIVAGHGPFAIWNYSPLTSYIAALGGYIYLMKNPADGLTVLDAASNTTENLNDIDGYDRTNVTAVGDNGAFVYTTDGYSFSLGTAPAAGATDLEAVAYRTEREIWVGDGNGDLYYTTDFGDHWYQKALPVSMSQIDKIVWANDTVGFVAGQTGGAGYVFRTIDGGYSWYTVPESNALSLPTNEYINDMAVCNNEVNKLFIGGIKASGDGILIKGSDY